MSRRQVSMVEGTVVNDWLSSILRRLNNNLPHKTSSYGPNQEKAVAEARQGLVELGTFSFVPVLEGLMRMIESLQETAPPTTADSAHLDSYCILLQSLTLVLSQRSCSQPEDVPVLERLSHMIYQMCFLKGERLTRFTELSTRVLYHLSALHFHSIYTTKIVYKLTSPLGPSESLGEGAVWQLIPHLNLDARRLMMLVTALVACFQDGKKNRHLPALNAPLRMAIWNFIRDYPTEFSALSGAQKGELSRFTERLFDICESYSDNARKKAQLWPLQNMLLMLCPSVLKGIASGSTSESLKSKSAFVVSLQKALTNKPLADIAATCGVEMAEACSYVDPKETTVYRYYVTAVQAPLQDLLFNHRELFIHNTASQAAGVPMFNDLKVMTDCFIAHYHINHRNTHLTHVCLDPASPPVFRLALVKAVEEVLTPKYSPPWWPARSTLQPLGSQLRALFQDQLLQLRRHDPSAINQQDVRAYFQNVTTATTMLNSKPKAERKALVESLTDYQTTRTLISVFLSDPELAFAGDNNTQGQDSLKLMTSLAGLVQHPSMPELALKASQALLALHEPQRIELWARHTTMKSFFDISCQVTFTLAMKLISRKATDSQQLMLWFKQILHYRSQFLQKHKDKATFDREDNRFFTKTQNMLEVVMLTYLHVPDVAQVQMAMSCFQFLIREAEILLAGEEGAAMVPYLANLEAYRELARASTERQIGRAAQQKKIYSILKRVVYTEGSAMAWDDSYSSWRSLTSVLVNYQGEETSPPPDFLAELVAKASKRYSTPAINIDSSDDNIQNTLMEWSNITGFLCAAGGVAVHHGEVMTRSNLRVSFSPTPSSTPAQQDFLSARNSPRRSNSYAGERRYRTHRRQASNTSNNSTTSDKEVKSHTYERDRVDSDASSSTASPDLFVSELLGLLKCENEVVGGQVCEMVKELVGYELSPLLFRPLFQCLRSSLRHIFDANDIAIVTPINSRLVDQVTSILQHILERKAEENAECWPQIRVEETIPILVNYAHQLDMSDYSVSVRVKLCQLLEVVMAHCEDLTFHREIQFRNQMIAIVTQWIHGKVHTEVEGSVSRDVLMHDLDLASLKAVSILLKGLPLQVDQREGDFTEEKTKLFKKYYTLFLNVLGGLEQVTKDTRLHAQLSVKGDHKAFRSKQLLRHVMDLKETTIAAMSNMLVANIDSGLSHAIAMGYHQDLLTRGSFVESLAAILKQGAQFHSLANTVLADCYNEMLSLVAAQSDDGGFPVIMLLADTVPLEMLDEVARLSLMVCDHLGRLEPFLTKVLVNEVEAMLRGQIDVIFRGNSFPCKLLSQSFHTFGFYFLQSVLRPIVINLLQDREKRYEVDPSREPDPEAVRANQQNLREVTSSFLDQLSDSVELLPHQVQTVCRSLNKVLQAHYPQRAAEMLSSTVFLRFINPALVAPQHFGLVNPGEIPPSAARGLTLMSKILQNLANHLPFRKEGHMMDFNDFLEANFDKTRKIALAMSSAHSPVEEERGMESVAVLKEADKYALHMLLWEHIDEMISTAATTRALSADHPVTKGPLVQLSGVLHRLGSPSEQQRRTARRNTIVNNRLEEYLIRTSRDISKQALHEIRAKEIFYYGGTSKAGRPVFYLVLHNFLGDKPGFASKVLYHVMSTLHTFVDTAFELVLDVTAMQPHNVPDLDTMVQFAVFVPELAMSQLDVIYLFNCNTHFRSFANKLPYRIFSHIKGAKKLVVIDNLSKFHDFIDPSALKLAETTMAYETDQQAMMFPSVYLLGERQSRASVSLRVTSEGVVVTYSDRQQVFGQAVLMREVHHISTFKEAQVEEEGKERFTIRLLSVQQGLHFSMVDPWPAVKLVNQMLSKWQIQQPSRYISERQLRPSDVPGTFLNIALYNVGSPNTMLRLAAYNLLCAMKDAFHLTFTGHILEAQHLCVPALDVHYICHVSEELATNEPQLTLEFLTEAIGNIQKADTQQKLFCLAYMSPWLLNLGRFAEPRDSDSDSGDGKKLINVLKMLINLTHVDTEMSPALQSHVWSTIGRAEGVLDLLLDLFVQEGCATEADSPMVDTLASCCVPLAASGGRVSGRVIKRILKVLGKMPDKSGLDLEQQPSWAELAVLVRMLLYLSFQDRLNVLEHLPSVFFICLMLLSCGPPFIRASLHGTVINTIQSLSSLDQFRDKDEVLKGLSLKMVELSHQRAYYLFGIPDVKSTAYAALQPQLAFPHAHFSEATPSSLSVPALLTVADHFMEILELCATHIPGDMQWVHQWEGLATTYAFDKESVLQPRAFVALAAWSRCKCVQVSYRTTLQVLQWFAQAIASYPSRNFVAETIIVCLSRYSPHMDKHSMLLKHLFWVAVGTLQLEDPQLYAAAQLLLQECITHLEERGVLDTTPLSEVLYPTRTALESHLKEMDRQVGISFTSDFHFALTALLYKGFHHPMMVVRQRAMTILGKLYQLHTPRDELGAIDITQHNLAYVTALYTVNDKMRVELLEGGRPHADNNLQEGDLPMPLLLNNPAVSSRQSRLLLLLLVSAAIVHSEDAHKVSVLYKFLSEASDVFKDVYPIIYTVLKSHMSAQLGQSHNHDTVTAVQKLVCLAIQESSLNIPHTMMRDIGFSRVIEFTAPFSKSGSVATARKQASLFHAYLSSLVQRCSTPKKTTV